MDQAPDRSKSGRLSGGCTTSFVPSQELLPEGKKAPNYRLFCYSAHEKNGVSRTLEAHAKYLDQEKHTTSPGFLDNYAFTMACRRSNLEWKSFIIAQSLDELQSKIQLLDTSPTLRSSSTKQPKICFLFCGQGSQWSRMGQNLQSFPSFWYSLNTANWYLKTVLGSPFDLIEEILKDDITSRISLPEIAQPAITAIQVALVDMFHSFGIKPSAVVGHSSGEIAAAFAAGAISREAAWEIAYYRGLAAGSIIHRAPKLKGGMLAAAMSAEEATLQIQDFGSSIQIACINSPRSVTLSGDAFAIELLAKNLEAKGIFCRVLKVQTAYHSSHMRLVETDYKDALHNLAPNEGYESVRMFSSVTGQPVHGSQLDASYWARNLVSTVQYCSAVQAVRDLPDNERPQIYLELSPAPTLKSPTAEILNTNGQETYLSTLNRKLDDAFAILQTVGQLWALGCSIKMQSVMSAKSSRSLPQCLANLPPYPWNHSKSYWHESHLGRAHRFRQFARRDLIGAPTADSVPFEPRWRGFLRISENPWIQDHQIQKTILYPAAGMISMVLEGATQITRNLEGIEGFEITDMSIDQAMIIPNTAHGLEVALNMKCDDLLRDKYEFAIYSKLQDKDWQKHCKGSLRIQMQASGWDAYLATLDAKHEALKNQCTLEIIPRQMYESLDIIGINYGPLFRNIASVSSGGSNCVSTVRVANTLAKMPAKFEYPHLLHPSTLDSIFQTLFAIRLETKVPTYFQKIFVSANLESGHGVEFEGFSNAVSRGLRDVEAEISMRQVNNPQGRIIINGFRLTAIDLAETGPSAFLPNYRNMCTEIVWKEDYHTAKPTSVEQLMSLLSHKRPALSILQIGGDVATAINMFLAVLGGPNDRTPRLSRYTVVSEEADRIVDFFQDTPFADLVEKKDLENISPKYDLIIIQAGQVASEKSKELKSKLAEDGVLLNQLLLTNGASHSPPSDTLSLRLCNGVDEWNKIWKTTIVVKDNHPLHFSVFSNASNETISTSIVVLASDHTSAVQDFAQVLASSTGTEVSVMTSDMVALDKARLEGKAVLSLLEIEQSAHHIFYWSEKDFEVFRTVTGSSKASVWLTQGATRDSQNPRSAAFSGLIRTLQSEDGQKVMAILDLGRESVLSDTATISSIASVCRRTFGSSSNRTTDPRESEFAEEQGKLYIPRLEPISNLNSIIDPSLALATFEEKDFQSHSDNAVTGLTLDMGNGQDPQIVEFQRRAPGPDEVEIAVEIAHLTAEDSDTFAGKTSRSSIGTDISGKVVRTGSNVKHLTPNDEVCAMIPTGGTIQDRICVDTKFVRRYGDGLQPSLHSAAVFGLIHRGNLEQGSRVLIHGVGSPFGLSALDIALAKSADVFVTVAGLQSQQYRQRLDETGIVPDHIFDLNDASFSTSMELALAGDKFDIIYAASSENLAEFCRFLSSSKSHSNIFYSSLTNFSGGTIVQRTRSSGDNAGRQILQGSASLVNMDIHQLWDDSPTLMSRMLDLAVDLLPQPRSKIFTWEVFPITGLFDALDLLQRRRDEGHIVVDMGANAVVPVLNRNSTQPLDKFVNPNGTYVLAGGLGGLGRSITSMLIRHGARHFAFLSRSGASSQEASRFISKLSEQGVDARVFAVDLCDSDAVNATMSLIEAQMPAVCGVFHCAAVVQDAVFDNMTYNDWQAAFRPKAHGAWNLLEHFNENSNSDVFHVFLASSSGVVGNRGQANYAAGNSALDAMASYCRQRGQKAVSIDLGPILGAGMLAEDEATLDILRASGFFGVRHEDFLTIIKHAIMGEVFPGTPIPPQVILAIGTGGLMLQNKPVDPYWTRTALYSYLNLVDVPKRDLSDEATSRDDDMLSTLKKCPDPAAATDIISTGLCNMLAKSMNMMSEEMDCNRPPNAYGVDSLVAVGVRNWVHGNCAVEVSVFDILSDVTIFELSGTIASKGGYGIA